MNSLVLCIVAAVSCVLLRAFLSVLDRYVFCSAKVDFMYAMVMNAVCPLLVAMFFFVLFSPLDNAIFLWLCNPGVILSGFGAQLTAIAFSMSFRLMPVRMVIITSKVSDLLIPFALVLFSSSLSLNDFWFTHLTTLAFFPIAWSIYKERGVHLPLALFMIGSLLLQAIINEAFHMSSYTTSISDFLRLMVGILTWRAIFILIPLLFQKQVASSVVTPFSLKLCLLARGFLAFFSQAFFFLSITRSESYIAWPILNIAPLLTCYVAHWVLKEHAGAHERYSFVLLTLVILGYVSLYL